MAAAWAGGLVLSLPGMHGFGRWDAGGLHSVIGSIPDRAVVVLTNQGWALAGAPPADWAIGAGVAGAAFLDIAGSFVIARKAHAEAPLGYDRSSRADH